MRFDLKNNKDVSDIYLIGNPQITYFKSVYRRHTNFAIRKHKTENITEGGQQNLIPILGDLIKTMSLEININMIDDIQIPNNIGTSIIDKVRLRAGQVLIEELSGSYINMYLQLNNPMGISNVYKQNISDISCISGTMEQILSLSGGVYNTTNCSNAEFSVIVPLPFSFTRNTGDSLPLFLFYNTRPLSIEVRKRIDITASCTYNLITDYIILTEDEKLRFQSSDNKYLYNQIIEIPTEISNGEREITIENLGNITSILWNNDMTKNYEYNIKVNDYKLLYKFMSYHYFSKHTLSRSGHIGCGTGIDQISNASRVVNNNSICLYSFSLLDDINDESISPSGSISSNDNNIKFVVKNSNTESDESIILYINRYNILTVSEEFINLDYQYQN